MGSIGYWLGVAVIAFIEIMFFIMFVMQIAYPAIMNVIIWLKTLKRNMLQKDRFTR